MSPAAMSQTVWDGTPIIFTKANSGDWLLEANQDRITDNVWITRKNSSGIFNIATEDGFSVSSPADTEWAFGSAANWPKLTFQTWLQWVNQSPPSVVNQPAVVHLISEDIYIDITFLSWTCCGNGGGFSYQRTTGALCPWDLDESDVVDTSDLLALFAVWGSHGTADFDGDGLINTNDLLILFANWGPCP